MTTRDILIEIERRVRGWAVEQDDALRRGDRALSLTCAAKRVVLEQLARDIRDAEQEYAA